jgi:hypothetical protein
MDNLLADFVQNHMEWWKHLPKYFEDFPKKAGVAGSLSKYAAKNGYDHISTSVAGAQGDQLSGIVAYETCALHSIPPYPRAARDTMQLSGNWTTQRAANGDSAGFSMLR